MNRIIIIIVCVSFYQSILAQIVYSEDFGTGCTTGLLATTFGWTMTNTGINESEANTWYVSADERGIGVGNCGDGCGGTNNRTLHVSSSPTMFGDLGAAYFESSPSLCTSFGWCAITDRRIESPVINCTSVSTIPFTFDYIENGEGTDDDATVWYSANGGGTWTLLDNPPKTTICGSGQGLWTARNLVLPASANNNPNVRIGFRWVNNGNGSGTDPSFAVDNIVVGSPIALGVDMIDMRVTCNASNQRIVSWETQNERDSDLFNVYKSKDGVSWGLLGTVKSVNEATGVHYYSLSDENDISRVVYYYIEQVDFDGKSTTYKILTGEDCNVYDELVVYPNPTNGEEINIHSSESISHVEFYSVDGKMLGKYTNSPDSKHFRVYPNLTNGHYLIRVYSDKGIEVVPLLVYQ